MSKPDQHKTLSERFEQEAEAGFRIVPGAEAYFSTLKNPFAAPSPAAVRWRRYRLFGLALLPLAILVPVMLLYNAPVQNPGQARVSPVVPPVQPVTAIQQAPVLTSPQPAPPARLARNNAAKIPVFTADTLAETLAVPDAMAYAVPTADTLEKTQPAMYRYASNRMYYRMHYLSDILVVDYGDSVTRLRLKPVVLGTPASYEQELKYSNDESPFETITENVYLNRLTPAMQAFSRADYASAWPVFQALATENPADQNALFYGGLCLYETGAYKDAAALFTALANLGQPVFEQDADYYLALCLLKTGRQTEAANRLGRIVHSDSFYRNKAAKILDSLK